MRAPILLVVAVTALTLHACDDGGSSGDSDGASPTDDLAETVPWSLGGVGTGQVPTFGKGCRFEAEEHLMFESNGAADDEITLTSGPSGFTLTLSLNHGSAASASVNVSLDQGLSFRSYRNASGSASGLGQMADLTGNIVDGAICFESKLSPSTGVAGEFTLVALSLNGTYVSLGGDFVLPPESVFPDGSTTDARMVDDAALNMDLQ